MASNDSQLGTALVKLAAKLQGSNYIILAILILIPTIASTLGASAQITNLALALAVLSQVGYLAITLGKSASGFGSNGIIAVLMLMAFVIIFTFGSFWLIPRALSTQ